MFWAVCSPPPDSHTSVAGQSLPAAGGKCFPERGLKCRDYPWRIWKELIKEARKSVDLANHTGFEHFLVSLTSRGKDAEFKFKSQLVANLRDSFLQVEGYSRGLSGFSCFSYKSTRTEIEREKINLINNKNNNWGIDLRQQKRFGTNSLWYIGACLTVLYQGDASLSFWKDFFKLLFNFFSAKNAKVTSWMQETLYKHMQKITTQSILCQVVRRQMSMASFAFHYTWSLCKVQETTLKAKTDLPFVRLSTTPAFSRYLLNCSLLESGAWWEGWSRVRHSVFMSKSVKLMTSCQV